MITVCFVYDHKQPTGHFSETLCRSVRRFDSSVRIVGAIVDGGLPFWFEELEIDHLYIAAPDPEVRFANKIACLVELKPDTDRVLFLDSDVLVCRPLFPAVKADIAGVHVDYPCEATTDYYVKEVYRLCGVVPPKETVTYTMKPEYGACAPLINSGVMLIRSEVVNRLAQVWLEFFHRARRADFMQERRLCYAEQMTLMPALVSLGLSWEFLPPKYNWNGTSAPAQEDTVLFHYHRQDILDNDPIASKVLV